MKGGVTLNDRKLGAKARTLILNEVIRLFETDPLKLSQRENERKEELLLRMSPNCLPRLTEVTGEGGGPIQTYALSKEEKDKLDALLHGNEITTEQAGAPDGDSGNAGSAEIPVQ